MFKSDYGRTTLHNVDTSALFLYFISVDRFQSFDQLFEKFKHIYDIYLFNDKWHCTCPCFVEHAMCKHMISFKLNVLKEKVPPEKHMSKLLVSKKRGRTKTIPGDLERIDAEDNDEDD